MKPASTATGQLVTLKVGISRIHLLPCIDGFLQVDTCYGWSYDAYRRALAQHGLGVRDVRYLFLTHHHDDHAGCLNELTTDGDVRVIAHAAAEPLLAAGKNDKSRGGGYVSRRVKVMADLKMRVDKKWTLTFDPFVLRQQDIRVSGDDAELLPLLGVPGRILATPGHTVDSIVLQLDSGEVFCGDAAANLFGFAGTKHCAVFMTDMEQAYESWRKMLAAGATTVYPAHGRPFPAEGLRRHLDALGTSDLVRFF